MSLFGTNSSISRVRFRERRSGVSADHAEAPVVEVEHVSPAAALVEKATTLTGDGKGANVG
jgi:hypothetical protein